METIIGLLKSPSTSISSTPFSTSVNSSATTAESVQHDLPDSMPPSASRFEALPAEIISHILAFLPPLTLASLSRTCSLLRSHACNDLLWMSFIRNIVPGSGDLGSPSPSKTWRDVYVSHHPYWFLVEKKIWFADVRNNGLLILARYNSQNCCIEAFRLLAEHGPHTFENWAHNPEVIIHTFRPKVSLWLDDPVIKLGLDKGKYHNGNRLRQEVAMQTGRTHGICSMISLCRPIPTELQAPAMALWPPATIPAKERVRNESANRFRTQEHRPHTLDHMSEGTFRIRKWLEFSNLMQPLNAVRMGEEVMTFSTLVEESYMPTKDKPWQGIWVGDYSGHGCEFLLVLQRKTTAPMALSPTSSTNSLPRGMAMASLGADLGLQDSDLADQYDGEAKVINNSRDDFPAFTDDQPSGRLEAIKLTGDVNVPRGEYTWIAEDIGPNGLIRVAKEQMFLGARTVKSWGHIAGRGYRHDRFIPSQLIMISHDSLAQYWEVSRACIGISGTFSFTDHFRRTLAIFLSTKESTSTTISKPKVAYLSSILCSRRIQ